MVLFYTAIFLLGVCIGSFFNVLVDRIQNNKALTGRSKCDFCGYQLRWFDNIPVLSFFLVGGNCRKCKKSLSWQYPFVESLTGCLVVITSYFFLKFNTGFEYIANSWIPYELSFILTYSLIFLLIAFWDIKYLIIPNKLIVIGLSISLVEKVGFMFFENLKFADLLSSLGFSLVSAFIVMLFFLLIYFLTRGAGIGFGDVKLGFWLGSLIEIKLIYFFLTIAYLSGAIIAIAMLFFGKKDLKSKIPFGPFLVFSSWIILIFEKYFLGIYERFFSL